MVCDEIFTYLHTYEYDKRYRGKCDFNCPRRGERFTCGFENNTHIVTFPSAQSQCEQLVDSQFGAMYVELEGMALLGHILSPNAQPTIDIFGLAISGRDIFVIILCVTYCVLDGGFLEPATAELPFSLDDNYGNSLPQS